MTVRRVVLTAICMMFAQVALQLVRPMTSYRLLALGESSATIGWLTAVYALAPLLLALPAGRVAGSRALSWIAIAGGGTLALACVGLSLSTAVWHFAVASAVLGAGNLGQMIAYQAIIAAESRGYELDRNYGWMSAGAAVGQLAGPVLGTAVLEYFGGGLHATSIALGVGAVAAAVGFAVTLPLLRGARVAAAQERPPDVPMRKLAGQTLRHPGAKASIYVSMVGLAAVDLLTVYMPVLGNERGLTPGFVGLLLGVRATAALAARLVLGWLVSRFSRRLILLAATTTAAVLMCAVPVLSESVVLVLVMIGLGVALGTGQPVAMAWNVSVVPLQERPTAIALRLMGNRLGQFVLPGVASLFAAVGGAAAVFVMLGIMLASALPTVASSDG